MAGRRRGCCRCSIVLNIFWVMFLLLATFYMISSAVGTITSYLEYPMGTTRALVRAEKVEFPAVTICNNNRYLESMLNGTVFKSVLDAKSSDVSDLGNLSKSVTNITGEDLARKEKSSAHRLDAMLKECKWGGKPCTDQNFNEVYTSVGACYTFNSGNQGYPVLSADSFGEDQGLILSLDVQQREYSPLTKTAGFKVFLHEQGKPPLTENPSTYLTPGFHSHIAVDLTVEERLSKPYADDCTGKKRASNNYPKYSKSACLLDCLEELVVEACRCRSIEFKTDVRYCDSVELVTCLLPAQERFKRQQHEKCNCPEECDKMIYGQAWSSYTVFPSQASLKSMSQDMNLTTEEVRSNLVRASIFYQNPSYVVMQNKPALTYQLVLNILIVPFLILSGFVILSIMQCSNAGCSRAHKENGVVV